jgi:exosortase H (IPTLxxWG-CTERM-specific)
VSRRSRERERAAESPAKNYSPHRRFLAKFLGLMFLYYGLTAVPWVDRHILYPVLEWSAYGSAVILRCVGEKTRVERNEIHGARYGVSVKRGCDPVDPIMLFCAGVVACPASIRRKLIGIAGGTVFLFSVNLVRITSMFLIGLHLPRIRSTVHEEWWPALMIVEALAAWVIWSRWALREVKIPQ